MNRNVARFSLAIAVLCGLISCASRVPYGEVPGTYIASYPFGTDTITLNRDGTFVQTVAIQGQQPATVRGTWTFDAKESDVIMQGDMVVDDGFGNLRRNWRTVEPGISVADVGIMWFKVTIGTAAMYPYVKQ